MNELQMVIKRKADLNKGLLRHSFRGVLMMEDAGAHRLEISCVRGEVPVAVNSGVVNAYFVRRDGSTVIVPGSAEGHVISVVLSAECYAVEGNFELLVKVLGEGEAEAVTVYWGGSRVQRGRTDALVDPGDVIPSLDELLAQISAMETATKNANQAAETADAAANAASAATTAAQDAAEDANAATEAANTAAENANAAAKAANALNISNGTGKNALVQKGNGATATGEGAVAFGAGTRADSVHSHAEGAGATASGAQSHAEGASTTASGPQSHAEGAGTTASGMQSHAEGASTTASGERSHAEGVSTAAIGSSSHAEGYDTTASGAQSHAEGASTAAIGPSSHAEGSGGSVAEITFTCDAQGTTIEYSIVSGSVSVGYYVVVSNGNVARILAKTDTTLILDRYLANQAVTTAWKAYVASSGALGSVSHAEGANTTASGNISHAEGANTTASGAQSHAEGYSTTASGMQSHAEGCSTTASGMQSHAEGYSTIAAGKYQHVEGKHNKEDTAGRYAHIVGNGSGPAQQSNAHTVDWAGNAWFRGDVLVGGEGQDDTAAEKLARMRQARAVNLLNNSHFDMATSMHPVLGWPCSPYRFPCWKCENIAGISWSASVAGMELDNTDGTADFALTQTVPMLPSGLKDILSEAGYPVYTLAVHDHAGKVLACVAQEASAEGSVLYESQGEACSVSLACGYSSTDFVETLAATITIPAGMSCTMMDVVLYPGAFDADSLPPVRWKGLVNELAATMAVCQKIPAYGYGWAASETEAYLHIPLAAPMRKAPVVLNASSLYFTTPMGGSVTSWTLESNDSCLTVLRLVLTGSGWTAGQMVMGYAMSDLVLDAGL